MNNRSEVKKRNIMAHNDIISVIIPMYNAACYIRNCLNSIVKQKTEAKIEIICVDDGSSDASLEIATRFSKNHEHIRSASTSNGNKGCPRGQSVARNIGLSNSIGEFVLFVDADDELPDGAINKLYSVIRKGNVDAVIGSIEIRYDKNVKISQIEKNYFEAKQKGVCKTTPGKIYSINCSVCGKLFKRSIIERYKLRFPEGCFFEDAYWHWTYFSMAKSIALITDCTYLYLRHANTTMSNLHASASNYAIDHLRIIQKMYGFLEMHNKLDRNCQVYVELLTNYFGIAFENAPLFQRPAICVKCAQIAKKYHLNYRDNEILGKVVDGDIGFLFSKEEGNCDDSLLFLIRMTSIFNRMFPRDGMVRRIIFSLGKFILNIVQNRR